MPKILAIAEGLNVQAHPQSIVSLLQAVIHETRGIQSQAGSDLPVTSTVWLVTSTVWLVTSVSTWRHSITGSLNVVHVPGLTHGREGVGGRSTGSLGPLLPSG